LLRLHASANRTPRGPRKKSMAASSRAARRPRLRLAETSDAAALSSFCNAVDTFRHAAGNATDIQQQILAHPPGNIVALAADEEAIVGGLLSVRVDSVDELTRDHARALKKHRSDGSLWFVIDELVSPRQPAHLQQLLRDWLMQQILLRAASTPGVSAVVVPVRCSHRAEASETTDSGRLNLQMRRQPPVLRHLQRGARLIQLLPPSTPRLSSAHRSKGEPLPVAGELMSGV
jgi:hypothetical protein